VLRLLQEGSKGLPKENEMTTSTDAIKDLYVVIDRQSGAVVSKPMSFKAAIRSVDRRDNAYGGYKYGKRRVEVN
jgi:hypothetical protein